MSENEYGYMFIIVNYDDDNPEDPWEPIEVFGPFFNRISSEGYDYEREIEQ